MTNYQNSKLISYLKFTFPKDTVDFWLEKINPTWSLSEKKSVFLRRLPEAKNTFTLYFKVNHKTVFPKAGQHLNISVEVDGRLLTRSYTPTVIDRENHIIGITVKTVDNGVVSTWLNYSLRPEETVKFSVPYGEFSWPNNTEPVILLAAGSGITPFISLLKENINSDQPICLHYWSKTRDEACFIEEFKTMQITYPNFSFQLHLTQEQVKYEYERHGRISQSIREDTPQLKESHLLVCGPNDFVTEASNLLATNSKTFLSESFSPPIFKLNEEEEQTYTLTLNQQNKTISVPNNKSILEALLENGVNHPYGCKMGICITCVCHKISGRTKSALTNKIDIEDNPALKVCTEYAKSDITLDI